MKKNWRQTFSELLPFLPLCFLPSPPCSFLEARPFSSPSLNDFNLSPPLPPLLSPPCGTQAQGQLKQKLLAGWQGEEGKVPGEIAALQSREANFFSLSSAPDLKQDATLFYTYSIQTRFIFLCLFFFLVLACSVVLFFLTNRDAIFSHDTHPSRERRRRKMEGYHKRHRVFLSFPFLPHISISPTLTHILFLFPVLQLGNPDPLPPPFQRGKRKRRTFIRQKLTFSSLALPPFDPASHPSIHILFFWFWTERRR